MFVTNWISPTKIQKISEITNFFRHYFLSRTEVNYLFTLETDIESGTKSREISIVVFDVLERWLKGDGFR